MPASDVYVGRSPWTARDPLIPPKAGQGPAAEEAADEGVRPTGSPGRHHLCTGT
jgi:hypothetical protein